jgi:hypothetical protein
MSMTLQGLSLFTLALLSFFREDSSAQFFQRGLKMGEAYYYEYQEIKVQPSHSNVNSPNPRAIQLPPFIVKAPWLCGMPDGIGPG